MNSPTGWQVAQANVSYLLAPITDPKIADFVALLDEINALAETSEGFVWRYISDSRVPDEREFEDPNILFNMSVWDSVEALHAFTYRTAHAKVFAARKQWFEDWKTRMGTSSFVLWWIPVGHIPTAAEAKAAMQSLADIGPTPAGFTFKLRVDPPNKNLMSP